MLKIASTPENESDSISILNYGINYEFPLGRLSAFLANNEDLIFDLSLVINLRTYCILC